MTIREAFKEIEKLQNLIGKTIPNTNKVIDAIIPAPNNDDFSLFLENYLYTQDIFKTLELSNSTNFDILLLSNSKKKGMFDTKTITVYDWYNPTS